MAEPPGEPEVSTYPSGQHTHAERAVQGERGETGETGETGEPGAPGPPGEPGMPRSVRSAIVALFLLTLALSAVNLFWTSHLVQNANRAKCGTVLALARLPVPASDITPGARRFDIALTSAFAHRARELGCT